MKTASLIIVVLAAAAFAFSPTGASADHTTAHTIEQLQAQIATLQAEIQRLRTQLQPGAVQCTFTRNLSFGSTGEDVRCLQRFLNAQGFLVASIGPGSPGNETLFFGPLTQAAVISWQEANAANVLTPLGLAQGTGFWGPMSRARYSTIIVVIPPSDGVGGAPDQGVPGAAQLTVAAATPHSPFVLAPENAARVPFTRVTFSASGSDVTINSLTVERQGVANDAAFERIVLIDEATGFQIGLSQTLNAEHRATFREPITISAGTSRTITIAANMASDLSPYQGQIGRLALVAVDAGGAQIAGTTPVVGNDLTLNSTLDIGSLTMTRGTTDPGSSQTKEVGLDNFTFAAIRATAGSVENITLESVRFNQAGSAASGDLADVRVVVDGSSFPATVSSDGKFYSAKFDGGVSIPKGSVKEIALVGDIVSGSGRTVSFDILRKTDIVARGNTFGYHLTASGGSTGSAPEGSLSSNLEPFYNGYTLTIAQGSLRSEKSNAVSAGNIAIDISDTPLGAFLMEARGEPVQISNIAFTINTTGSGAPADISLLSIADESGTLVAGPVTPVGSTVTFTSTWTVPAGTHTYIIKGKLDTDFANGDTVTLSFTPANITARGETTGLSITPTPSTSVSLNTQTVRGSALTVSVSETPSSQTVIAGANAFTFARYQFDATASGEDIRVTSLKLRDTYAGSPGTNDLNSCQILDGAAALNTGANAVNPSLDGTSPDDVAFTLDTHLLIPKGTFKTVDLRCNVSSGAVSGSSHSWGISSAVTDNVVATGAQTGVSITPNVTTSAGQAMTVGISGPLSVTLDPSSPAERLGLAGSNEVLMSVLRFEAQDEPIRLEKVGLALSGSGASSADINKVTLWDGATKLGEAFFTGGSTTTTLNLTQTLIIPKDGTKTLTVKADLAPVGTNQPGTTGHQLEINYDGANNTETSGIGQSSGQAVNPPAGANTAGKGVRLVKTFPIIETLPIPTNTLVNGDVILYRFKVTAGQTGDAGLYKFTFKTSTSSVTLSNFSVFGYSDADFSSVAHTRNPLNDTPVSADANGIVEIYFNPVSLGTNEAIHIPAGASRWYELRATASGVVAGAAATIQLEGDAAYLASGFTDTAANVDADANDDFIWSPNTTTTATPSTSDWLNGFLAPGLPSTNASPQVLSK